MFGVVRMCSKMTAKELNNQFKEAGRTLGSAESFTGGLFAREITRVPGASKVFKGALVTYATEEKNRILGISQSLINRVGVVSQEVAGEMASHAKQLLNVDYCISFTGNAGPDAMEGKPVGEIYIGVAAYEMVQVYKYQLNGTREQIQDQAVNLGYQILSAILQNRK